LSQESERIFEPFCSLVVGDEIVAEDWNVVVAIFVEFVRKIIGEIGVSETVGEIVVGLVGEIVVGFVGEIVVGFVGEIVVGVVGEIVVGAVGEIFAGFGGEIFVGFVGEIFVGFVGEIDGEIDGEIVVDETNVGEINVGELIGDIVVKLIGDVIGRGGVGGVAVWFMSGDIILDDVALVGVGVVDVDDVVDDDVDDDKDDGDVVAVSFVSSGSVVVGGES